MVIAQVTARELAGSGCICSKRMRKSKRCGDLDRWKLSSLTRLSGSSNDSRMVETEHMAAEGVSSTCVRVEDRVARYDSLKLRVSTGSGIRRLEYLLFTFGSKIPSKTHGNGTSNQFGNTTQDHYSRVSQSRQAPSING